MRPRFRGAAAAAAALVLAIGDTASAQVTTASFPNAAPGPYGRAGVPTAHPGTSVPPASVAIEVTLYLNGAEADASEVRFRREAGLTAVAVVRNVGADPVRSLEMTGSGLGVPVLPCDDDSIEPGAETLCRAPWEGLAAGERRQIVVEAVGLSPDGTVVRDLARGRVVTVADAYTGVVGLPLSMGVLLALVVLGGFLAYRHRTRRR